MQRDRQNAEMLNEFLNFERLLEAVEGCHDYIVILLFHMTLQDWSR